MVFLVTDTVGMGGAGQNSRVRLHAGWGVDC